ncbi:DUF1707 domain-containing protein [Streptomyces prunicolor]|uniref:DUF1707 SHOCT-like domain-containing protein n=1 Tax=Streptomyces prunicolor TaxID=67348 RepID=UPI00225B0E7B|nr:DUF1707 domain-containing protein [Streptomyces prunicolor]MCX5241716.1 DUF1707 domain-containing protein [Streptomyces prunicolor]
MHDSEEHPTSPALRASDAERDQVEARLQHHYAVGRLTLPELEGRAVAAYEARTREQLQDLLADLPGEAADLPAPSTRVIDSRLLIVLLCVSPPAALIYWLIRQRAARRRPSRPQAGEGKGKGEGAQTASK